MIRMRPDGTMEFDSADELVDYQHKRDRARVTRGTSDESAKAPSEATNSARWEKLLHLIGRGKQLEFLHVLRSNPAGVTRDAAMAAVGVDNGNALAGVVGGGLAKNIETAGLNRRDVYLIEKMKDGEKRYRPGPMLLRHDVNHT